ncbi:hypothetical protein F383_17559 [Gossypium arboreum]|uniref:Uncharacterized protein n=1 Tax=Gossypium arboreum TaxID=29729 RepID=A0A0B0NPV9_GOSAR|nr:hypothetical protein F383_17559 [Gossypium arboreum]
MDKIELIVHILYRVSPSWLEDRRTLETRFTLPIGHLGLVSLNILSMVCIGTWFFFCYMLYWSSQMCWLMVIFDLFCIWPCDMVHIDYLGCNPN